MLTFTIAAILLMAFAVAGWPLLIQRRLRPALQFTSGSCCIVAGSTLMGLLTAGLIALPGTASLQAAQEKSPDSSTSVEPAGDSKPPENPTAPAAVPPALAPSEIVVDTSDSAPAVKADDIKIETLPDGTIQIPAGRPQWVKDSKPNFTGSIHTIPVTSGPYKLSRDAQRGLEETMKRATDEYIADQLNSPLAAKFIPYSLDVIQDRFVKQTYNETINFGSVGPMEQRHALLQFDDAFREELRHHWVGRIAESRLYQTGLGAGAVLLLLTSVFGYFRLDNATRGYYTGRLQFMTAAAILAIVALGAAAAFRFTWL